MRLGSLVAFDLWMLSQSHEVLSSIEKAAKDLFDAQQLWRLPACGIDMIGMATTLCTLARSQFLWGDHGMAMAGVPVTFKRNRLCRCPILEAAQEAGLFEEAAKHTEMSCQFGSSRQFGLHCIILYSCI